jgi:hypothetical protein
MLRICVANEFSIHSSTFDVMEQLTWSLLLYNCEMLFNGGAVLRRVDIVAMPAWNLNTANITDTLTIYVWILVRLGLQMES